MTALRTLLILLIVVTGLPAAAQPGTCAAIGGGGRLAAYTTEPALVQAGVRAFFRNPAQRLTDGIIGQTTRNFLIALCNEVPLPPETDPVAGTVALAEAYGRLEGARTGWLDTLSDPAVLTRIRLGAAGGFNRESLALAGSTRMAVAVLDGQDAACEPDGDLGGADLARVQTGLTALLTADPGLPNVDLSAEADRTGPATQAALAAVCEAYPGLPTTAAAAVAMGAYATLATDPDALATLGSEGYVAWVFQAPETRLRRQIGTPDTVRALLADYRASRPAPAQPVTPTPPLTPVVAPPIMPPPEPAAPSNPQIPEACAPDTGLTP
ncbi:MAG: hypothetical protein AAFQ51_13625, partial [Pseudomonadota bacterium]